MYVRYQTVRNVLIGLLAVGGITGLVIWIASFGDERSVALPAARVPVATSTPVATPTPATTTTPARAALDDAAIIARADQPASAAGEKVKDAIPGAVKVNLYEETGDTRFDRLKVDRGRDEVWDEQWVRKDGVWRKEDGAAWDGARWIRAGEAPGPAPTPTTTTTPTPTPRPDDPIVQAARTVLEGRASADKVKDLYDGRGPKVNLYDDDRDGRWDRAKVDHDRDDVWDESWTVKGGALERKITSSGAVELFRDGAWVAKP